MDCCLRDGAERWTGNLAQLPEHRACSEARFFGHDGLFATHRYRITHSLLARHNGASAGDINLRVFVNDREVGEPLQCASADGLSFDRELGPLSAGDTVHVAVGPNGGNWADAFDLDFSLSTLGGR